MQRDDEESSSDSDDERPQISENHDDQEYVRNLIGCLYNTGGAPSDDLGCGTWDTICNPQKEGPLATMEKVLIESEHIGFAEQEEEAE